MLKFFDKLINPITLLLLGIGLIAVIEISGGGTFFADSGIVHSIVIFYVVLIVIRILSEYAYGDTILRTFSKIQVGFVLFLGMVHVFEYIGLNIFMLQKETVEFSIIGAYILWLFGNIAALEFMFRTYYKNAPC